MRLANVTSAAVGLIAGVKASGSDACGAEVTVFVTAPAVTSFVTLDTLSVASAAAVDISALNDNLDITPLVPSPASQVSNGDKVTHMTYLTYTRAITVAPPASSSTVKAESDHGTYFYAVQSGTTVWLNDKTPSATSGLIYGTTTVIVSPVPTAESESDSTTTTTTILKKTSTRFVTVTTTRATTSIPSATRSYPGYGSNGWNSTVSTIPTVAVGPTATGLDKAEQSIYKPTVVVPTSQNPGSGYAPVGTVKPYRQFKEKRAPNQWITATINEHVVSWINTRAPNDMPTPAPTPVATATPYTVTDLYDFAALMDKLNFKQASSFYALIYATSPTSPEPTYVPTPPATTSSQPSVLATTAEAPTTAEYTLTVASSDVRSVASTGTLANETTSAATTTGIGAVDSTQAPTTVYQQLETVEASATSVITSSAAIPSSCGEYGNFTLDFEDLPDYSAKNESTDYPPIFSPYHHLFFSDGFGYAPPPSDPYIPVSPPHLAIFVPSPAAVQDVANGPPDAPNAGYGSISAGPRASDSAYWFDVLGGYWGCQDAGPENCTLHFHVFQWYIHDNERMEEEMSSISRTIPACVDQNCPLVYFGEGNSSLMRNLTTLRVSAEVGGVPKNFFVDNLQLRWSNSTCEAGRERQSSH
ncbi:MAG: hypothetical protein M1835_004405 [Candelina submexicana]|nr:MAG: hypothetical protein M1835_004405 [Candelina submexicana]